jgi:hypothetical protein
LPAAGKKLVLRKAHPRPPIFLFYKLIQANTTSGACRARPPAAIAQYLQYRLPVLLMKS